jgi:taurine transport system permease protein
MKLRTKISISVISVTLFFLLWQTAAERQWVDPLLLP